MNAPNPAPPRHRGANGSLLRLLVAAGTLLAVAGCGSNVVIDCTALDFSSLEKPTSRLRIVDRHGEPIRETDRRTDIEALLRFVAARPDAWCRPLDETPVGWLGVELYMGNFLQDTFQIGPSFIGVGHWRIRNIDLAERQELLRLLGVADPYAVPERRLAPPPAQKNS